MTEDKAEGGYEGIAPVVSSRRDYVAPFLRHLDISVETNGKYGFASVEHPYTYSSVHHTAGLS